MHFKPVYADKGVSMHIEQMSVISLALLMLEALLLATCYAAAYADIVNHKRSVTLTTAGVEFDVISSGAGSPRKC